MIDSYLMGLVSTHTLYTSNFINVGSTDVPFEIVRDEGNPTVLVLAKHEDLATISWGDYVPEDFEPEALDRFAHKVCERLSMISLLSQHSHASSVAEIVSKFKLYPDRVKMSNSEECMIFRSPFGYQTLKFYPNSNLIEVIITWGHFKYERDFRLTPITDIGNIINEIEEAVGKLGITAK